MVKTGRFAEAKPILEDIIAASSAGSSAYSYIESLYYMGLVNEGLGSKQAAIKNYQQVLSYWKDADVEVEPLAKTRERLKQLTS